MNKYSNNKSKQKLNLISEYASLYKETDKLTIRCKFNFHYFNIQDAGEDFKDWNHIQLIKLMNKLKNYSENSLEYWTNQNIGKGIGHVLEIYGQFPKSTQTDFSEPKAIPIEAQWGRFRLESSVRFIGFIIPNELHSQAHSITTERFDKNTFYVVFLDKDHKFYQSENK